ncbi:MAG: hypothetical protein WBB45_13415 [Cyclobacteriaceae bacterium]
MMKSRRPAFYTLPVLCLTFLLAAFSCHNGGNASGSEQDRQEPAMPQTAPPPEDYEETPPVERDPDVGEDCVDESQVDEGEVCYDLLQPVCGCDGITYSNDCQARKSGVLQYTEGACE